MAGTRTLFLGSEAQTRLSLVSTRVACLGHNVADRTARCTSRIQAPAELTTTSGAGVAAAAVVATLVVEMADTTETDAVVGTTAAEALVEAIMMVEVEGMGEAGEAEEDGVTVVRDIEPHESDTVYVLPTVSCHVLNRILDEHVAFGYQTMHIIQGTRQVVNVGGMLIRDGDTALFSYTSSDTSSFALSTLPSTFSSSPSASASVFSETTRRYLAGIAIRDLQLRIYELHKLLTEGRTLPDALFQVRSACAG